MTVRYGNAQALRGEVRALRGDYLAALYLAPYLERLSLRLLFLAADAISVGEAEFAIPK